MIQLSNPGQTIKHRLNGFSITDQDRRIAMAHSWHIANTCRQASNPSCQKRSKTPASPRWKRQCEEFEEHIPVASIAARSSTRPCASG
jgi:hypothetical protein